MGFLVVEKHVLGAEGLEPLVIGQTFEEAGFLYAHILGPEGVDHAGVRWAIAGGDDGNSDRTLPLRKMALSFSQGDEQLGEWPLSHRTVA